MITATARVEGEARTIDNLRKGQGAVKVERKQRMEQASMYLQNYIQRNKLSGNPLKRRTGNLANQMNYNVTETGDNVIGRVGNRMVYAAMHETGKTKDGSTSIIPKNGKYLSIPFGAGLTPAGVARRGSVRDYANTKVVRGKSGNLIVLDEKGQGIYVLVKRVKIVKRPFIAPALVETKNRIMDIIGEAIKTMVRVANGQ
jgi:phage gpG-like protein